MCILTNYFQPFLRTTILLLLLNQLGLGRLSFGGSSPDELRHVEVEYVSNSDCTTVYDYDANDITSSMLCARDDGKDSCQGDS